MPTRQTYSALVSRIRLPGNRPASWPAARSPDRNGVARLNEIHWRDRRFAGRTFQREQPLDQLLPQQLPRPSSWRSRPGSATNRTRVPLRLVMTDAAQRLGDLAACGEGADRAAAETRRPGSRRSRCRRTARRHSRKSAGCGRPASRMLSVEASTTIFSDGIGPLTSPTMSGPSLPNAVPSKISTWRVEFAAPGLDSTDRQSRGRRSPATAASPLDSSAAAGPGSTGPRGAAGTCRLLLPAASD